MENSVEIGRIHEVENAIYTKKQELAEKEKQYANLEIFLKEYRTMESDYQNEITTHRNRLEQSGIVEGQVKTFQGYRTVMQDVLTQGEYTRILSGFQENIGVIENQMRVLSSEIEQLRSELAMLQIDLDTAWNQARAID